MDEIMQKLNELHNKCIQSIGTDSAQANLDIYDSYALSIPDIMRKRKELLIKLCESNNLDNAIEQFEKGKNKQSEKNIDLGDRNWADVSDEE